jgi:hypothetical protein
MYTIVTFYFLNSANFHIVLIAYLRYVFLSKPLQSLTITTKRVLKMSGGVWLIGLLVSSLYGFRVLYIQEDGNYLIFENDVTFAIYVMFVPILFVVVLHVLKIVKLRQIRYMSPGQPSSITSKISAMLFVLLVTYIVSTSPAMFNLILHLVCFLTDYRGTLCQVFYCLDRLHVT